MDRVDLLEKRVALLERDIRYIIARLGEIMIHNPELADKIGFALGKKNKKKAKVAKGAESNKKYVAGPFCSGPGTTSVVAPAPATTNSEE